MGRDRRQKTRKKLVTRPGPLLIHVAVGARVLDDRSTAATNGIAPITSGYPVRTVAAFQHQQKHTPRNEQQPRARYGQWIILMLRKVADERLGWR